MLSGLRKSAVVSFSCTVHKTKIFHSVFKNTRKIAVASSVNRLQSFSSKPDSRLGPEPSAAGFVNYEDERKSFDLPVPDFYNFAEDVIDKWARKEEVSDVRQGLPAFWWVSDHGREVKWTFQDLVENSNRVSNILTGPCQLHPGDRVLVILPKLPQWWLLNIACIRTGVVMIPGSTQLTTNDIRDRLQRSMAKCIICDTVTAAKVDSIIDDCPSVFHKVLVEGLRLGWFMFEDLYLYSSNIFKTVKTRSSDPSMLFFTSGTTGHPKMAEHTHTSYGMGHKLTARYFCDLVPTDIYWVLSDLGWAKSAYALFTAWNNGACLFVDYVSKFDPERTLKLLQDYPITVFCGPATVYRYMMTSNPEKYNLNSVRHFVSAGEAVNPELVYHWLDKTGKLIHEGYGQTETTILCCSPKCLPVKPGSLGKAVPGVDVTVVDDNGKPVGTNEVGEIAVHLKPRRPLNLFTRYTDNEEKTAKVFTTDFYLTGDQAHVDEDGYFWFISRKDDLIMSAGYRIGPYEVESALLEHVAVLEAAVVSSPDEARGEVVKAFIVLHPDYQQVDEESLIKELQEHVKEVTAPFKYPRKIEFIDSLPRTVSGKVRRVELRNREWKRDS